MNDPGFVELGDLKMLIGTRVFDLSGGAVVDDETKIADRSTLSGVDRDIEIHPEAVGASDGDFALTPYGVFSRCIPRVERPATVIAVGAEIVDANLTGGNRGICLRESGTQTKEEENQTERKFYL
jgi:hypothetical protein